MKRFNANLLRAAVISLISCSAIITPARANTIMLDFSGVNGNAAGGYYISPYMAQIVGTTDFITLYCIDFNHEVDFGEVWQTDIQPLTFSNLTSDPSSFQYGLMSNAWTNYEEAAWLITQTQTSVPYQQDVYQYATWSIFLDPAQQAAFNNSVNSMGGSFGTDVNTALTDASNAVNNQQSPYQPLGWYVVSPVPAGEADSTQEFLTPAVGGFSPVATPEPVSILLLGTALLGVVFLARRHFNRKRAEQ